MQTFSQSFAAATTWELNISGRYFTTVDCTFPVNARFYKGGTLLDLGEIKGLLAGLEVTLNADGSGVAFDRVQIDVQAGDTVKIGIGNGQARYNRAQANVTVVTNKVPQSANFGNTQKTVTNASAQLVAANAARQYLLIQNKSLTGGIFVNIGAAATTGNGMRIGAGGNYELPSVLTTQAIYAIGDLANNPDIVVVEG